MFVLPLLSQWHAKRGVLRLLQQTQYGWQELSADIYTAHCSIYVQNSRSQSGRRAKFQTVALSLLVIVTCRLLTLFGTTVSSEMLAALWQNVIFSLRLFCNFMQIFICLGLIFRYRLPDRKFNLDLWQLPCWWFNLWQCLNLTDTENVLDLKISFVLSLDNFVAITLRSPVAEIAYEGRVATSIEFC